MQGLTDFYNANAATINLMGVNALLGLSLYLTLACAMLSLSNAASMGIGAYTAALLTRDAQWPLWPAVIAGALAAGLVALPLGVPVLRLRGVFLAIATIGFGEVLRIAIVNTPALGGPEGFRLPTEPRADFWAIWGTLAVVVFAFVRLRGSRARRAMEAIREDENAARSMGINVTFYKVAAYVAGSALAGLAGGLYAHSAGFISPDRFGFATAVDILVFAVIGGTTAFPGAILGAWLITALPELLRFLKDWRTVFNGVVLVGVILFLPNGLLTLGTLWPRRGATQARLAVDPYGGNAPAAPAPAALTDAAPAAEEEG
jgi:branched-chain amino acid transport system permease protein